jgi:hypothetical protein
MCSLASRDITVDRKACWKASLKAVLLKVGTGLPKLKEKLRSSSLFSAWRHIPYFETSYDRSWPCVPGGIANSAWQKIRDKLCNVRILTNLPSPWAEHWNAVVRRTDKKSWRIREPILGENLEENIKQTHNLPGRLPRDLAP